jgi:hypothetical protein
MTGKTLAETLVKTPVESSPKTEDQVIELNASLQSCPFINIL